MATSGGSLSPTETSISIHYGEVRHNEVDERGHCSDAGSVRERSGNQASNWVVAARRLVRGSVFCSSLEPTLFLLDSWHQMQL